MFFSSSWKDHLLDSQSYLKRVHYSDNVVPSHTFLKKKPPSRGSQEGYSNRPLKRPQGMQSVMSFWSVAAVRGRERRKEDRERERERERTERGRGRDANNHWRVRIICDVMVYCRRKLHGNIILIVKHVNVGTMSNTLSMFFLFWLVPFVDIDIDVEVYTDIPSIEGRHWYCFGNERKKCVFC